ncbi:putative transmembrane protein [Pectobacterium phage Q19]|uniref:Transmembrane protein n=1 Tax=Pectobacterium phage Q19 TaxID=2500576 RepID=A0A6C0T6Y5_9CAUD|nr:putative transmembrane protein [Pectobacterium phage Q19]
MDAVKYIMIIGMFCCIGRALWSLAGIWLTITEQHRK